MNNPGLCLVWSVWRGPAEQAGPPRRNRAPDGALFDALLLAQDQDALE